MSEQPVSLVGQVLVTPDANGFGDYIFLEELSLQIYYWPESAIKAGPTAEELRECTSRTQREELLNPWFNIGQKVRFEVCNERRGIATKVRKYGNVTHEYGIYPGVDEHVFKTICVLSDGGEKQCYSMHLKDVIADQAYVDGAMPFVPFNAFVAIDVDKDSLQCSFRLHSFDVDAPVAKQMREYALNVPFVRSVVRSSEPLPSNEEMDYAEPTEVDRWKAARAKEYEPQEILVNKGFFLKVGEIFCNAVPFWRVMVPWTPPKYRTRPWAGRVVKFEAYYCKLNKCYVVFKWRETDFPIDTGASTQEQERFENTYKAGLLRRSQIAGIYWNAHVGYVRDEARILEGFRTAPDQPIWAYLKHCFKPELFKFTVDSVVNGQYPKGPPQLREFRGIMVVTGLTGQLYAPELYDRKCVLPANMRAGHNPGNYVFVTAVCNAASGVFEVTSAKAVDTASIPVATNADRTLAVLKVRVGFVKEHPLYFWHDDFGPIKTLDADFISVARFKNIQPVIKILDTSSAQENSGCRFKCVGVVRAAEVEQSTA